MKNEHEIVLEERTLGVLDDLPVPIFIVRDDGTFLFANQEIQNVLGLELMEMSNVEAWITHIIPYSSQGDTLQSSFLYRVAQFSGTPQITVQPQGSQQLIWQLFSTALDHDKGGHKSVLTVAQDITDCVTQQKHTQELMAHLEQQISTRTETLNSTIAKLEKEILEKNHISEALTLSRERLKKISRHTLDILEADRQTISKELHDSIGASLAAIKFSLEEKELARNHNSNKLTESLNQEVGYLAATIKETKRISAHLRPSTLDDLGLVATIAWYIRQFQRLYGNIKIEYSSEIAEKDIPEPMKINIYRIIQEGLTNAERHSNASSVRLVMEYCDGMHSVSLSIEDNGCGFDVLETLANKDPLGGYGLIAMRERCEIFGGFFHLDSEKGGGTRVNAILPIK